MIQREIKHLHPLVAKWLDSNGYVYKREVKMPEYGRADFVAKDANDTTIIIECKVEMKRHSRESILQLLGYCHQLGEDVRGAIATIDTNIDEHAIKLCRYYHVNLIQIDASEFQCSINVEICRNNMHYVFSILFDIWTSRLKDDTENRPWFIIRNRDILLMSLIAIVQKRGKRIVFSSLYSSIDQLELEDYILMGIAAKVLTDLHLYRNSYGIAELTEDIDDVQPIIDVARPEIQKVFSKKPRRLGTSNKPKLIE